MIKAPETACVEKSAVLEGLQNGPGERAMPIWQLIPLDPTAPAWVASNYVGRVVIRAPTEREARQAAVQAFGKETPGVPWHAHPWNRLALVQCDELHQSGYPPLGRTAVLEPAGYSSWETT